MTKEQYLKITEPLRQDSKKADKIKSINHILTGLVFCIYPLYVLVLFLEKDAWLVRALLVPSISFVLLTIVRRIINAPRPYERFGIPPVIDKDTKGKSFPSRHVFSVFMIAMTIFYAHPGPGIILGFIGILLGITRVRAGVHEPRDVVAGVISGILCGVVGYYVI